MFRLPFAAVIFFATALPAGIAYSVEAGRIVFVAGTATISGSAVVTGQAVQEGNEIATGPDGYLYLKTVDNGFLILRPFSRARVTAYHIDAADPRGTYIKLELLTGVARHISGEAVKQARQNFRFNTPVAAIGVRGTDFTVFTDQTTSRVAVISGGVVVSGFSGTCGREGNGPCEGGASRELFAAQSGQIIQIHKGQNVPQILPINGLSPDLIAPPRSDEPPVKLTGGSIGSGAGVGSGAIAAPGAAPSASNLSLDAQKAVNLKLPLAPTPPISAPVLATPLVVASEPPPIMTPSVPLEAPKQILWGRWQPILDRPANIDLVKELNAKGEIIGLYDGYALIRSAGKPWDLPTTGSVGFVLKQSEASVFNETSRTYTPAALSNAQLQIDFAKATYATSFDLRSSNQVSQFSSQGVVSPDGQFEGRNKFVYPNNLNLNGLISPENGGSAAYIFQGRIDDTRRASGIATWGR